MVPTLLHSRHITHFQHFSSVAFHKFTKRSQTNLGIEIGTEQRLSGQLVYNIKIN
jgi:hypothetical protein